MTTGNQPKAVPGFSNFNFNQNLGFTFGVNGNFINANLTSASISSISGLPSDVNDYKTATLNFFTKNLSQELMANVGLFGSNGGS